ncbi:hypothetical protein RHSIM_Rhsim01G0064600 [Rhododendron simsii]|uniref:EF-hand domain-containing protein n=1 Tax=Rhododendron simsii TaxID=118357 RepID=A0A834HFJ3_RHOSS|nr:hypothetical protein RHSIM_Rhsim01G0064600 [Rhododendron simsii]
MMVNPEENSNWLVDYGVVENIPVPGGDLPSLKPGYGRHGEVIKSEVEVLKVGKGEEETAIRMDGALEPIAAKVESNYLTRLVVTIDPVPRTTIRTLFPGLHLWKRSITIPRRKGKITFKLQQRRGLFLSAELGIKFDSNDDGKISASEFTAVRRRSKQGVHYAFDLYDKDGNVLISVKELHVVMKSLRDKCSLTDCSRMIASVNVDGCVNFEEFKKMMKV